MKSILIKKNQLSEKSQKLQTAKFDLKLKRTQVTQLIEEQDKVYKQYEFYKNFIIANEKMRRIR